MFVNRMLSFGILLGSLLDGYDTRGARVRAAERSMGYASRKRASVLSIPPPRVNKVLMNGRI